MSVSVQTDTGPKIFSVTTDGVDEVDMLDRITELFEEAIEQQPEAIGTPLVICIVDGSEAQPDALSMLDEEGDSEVAQAA